MLNVSSKHHVVNGTIKPDPVQHDIRITKTKYVLILLNVYPRYDIPPIIYPQIYPPPAQSTFFQIVTLNTSSVYDL